MNMPNLLLHVACSRGASMSRIFISHSSNDNAEAVALRDWLLAQGWNDLFLDLDPQRGIAAGERWERALSQAANRCEAVLFLVSRGWLHSKWCLKEFNLAAKLNKRMFGVLVEDVPLAEIPSEVTSTWQLVNLVSGSDHQQFRAEVPGIIEESHVTFSQAGLQRLKGGLEKAGLDPKFFAWPPENDPERAPWRGLKALEEEDAGIFYGRDAQLIEMLDHLRGAADLETSRLFVILGASGAGKSSFLRAGLLPRLARDDRNFLPLPPIRPERAALSGESGLAACLEKAFSKRGLRVARATLNKAVTLGSSGVATALEALAADSVRRTGEQRPPTLLLPVDQAEELFQSAGRHEAEALLAIIRDLANSATLRVIVLFTIRSDAYEQLQTEKILDGIGQNTWSLAPMLTGAFGAVVEGPAKRLNRAGRKFHIEPALTNALLSDLEASSGKDALPLLSFTLERLYADFGGDGDLKLSEYREFGGISGSIDAAVQGAFRAADADLSVPSGEHERHELLRRAFIPWLAGIDPETGTPRRFLARLAELPEDTRPLVRHLIDARLLTADVNAVTGEKTIEPAHEALLRQWVLLRQWLEEDKAALSSLESARRAARDWEANGRAPGWLAHKAGRLEDAERLNSRRDLAARLEPLDRDYLSAARLAENDARDKELDAARRLAEAEKAKTRRTRMGLAAALVLAVSAATAAGWGWVKQREAEGQRQEAELQQRRATRQSIRSENSQQTARQAAKLAEEKTADIEELFILFSEYIMKDESDDRKQYIIGELFSYTDERIADTNIKSYAKSKNNLLSFLGKLIDNTESMDEEEKKYWLDILPSITSGQSGRLFGILINERIKLRDLDEEYQKKVAVLNEKHLEEWEAKKNNGGGSGISALAGADKGALAQSKIAAERNIAAAELDADNDTTAIIDMLRPVVLSEPDIQAEPSDFVRAVDLYAAALSALIRKENEDDPFQKIYGKTHPRTAELDDLRNKQWDAAVSSGLNSEIDRLGAGRVRNLKDNGDFVGAAQAAHAHFTAAKRLSEAGSDVEAMMHLASVADNYARSRALLLNTGDNHGLLPYSEIISQRKEALLAALHASPVTEGEKDGPRLRPINGLLWYAATGSDENPDIGTLDLLAAEIEKSVDKKLIFLDTLAVYSCWRGRGDQAKALYANIIERAPELSEEERGFSAKFNLKGMSKAIDRCAAGEIDATVHDWSQYDPS